MVGRNESLVAEDGVGGVGADSAGISPRKADVAGFSPLGAPRILDDPVVIGDPDNQHSMVDSSSALAHHSSPVEGPARRIDCHCDGLAR